MIRTPKRQRTSKKQASRAVIPRSRVRGLTVPRGIGRPTSGFPKLFTIKHVYSSSPVSGALTASTISTFQFSCNNLTLPTTAGGGHQPLYFDQVAALYDQYTVLSSKITWRVACASPFSAATSPHFAAVAYIEDDATPVNTFPAAVEQASATGSRIVSGGAPYTTITQRWDARQSFGGNAMDNPDLRGNSSTGPAELQNYTLVLLAPSATTAIYTYFAEIEYTAVWLELTNIASS